MCASNQIKVSIKGLNTYVYVAVIIWTMLVGAILASDIYKLTIGADERGVTTAAFLIYGLIWLMGVSGIGFGWLKLRRNLTDYSRAEEDIKELARFPDENPNPVIRISADGEILYSNGAAAPLLNADNTGNAKTVSQDWLSIMTETFNSGESHQFEVQQDKNTYLLTFAPVPESSYVNVYAFNVTDRKKVEDELLRSKNELDVRNKISNIFLSSTDDNIYADVLDVVIEVLESELGYFGYINNDGDLVAPSMTRHIWKKCKVAEKSMVFPHSMWSGLWGQSLREGKTLLSNKGFDLPTGHVSLRNALAVPIVHKGELTGQIVVANKYQGYADNDVRILETICEYIAPILHVRQQLIRAHEELEERVELRTKQFKDTVEALQSEVTHRIEAEEIIRYDQKQLQYLDTELILSEEKQRRAIATELHDSVGQILAFSKIELGKVQKNASDEVKESLMRVREMIEQAIDQTRTLTFDLSPPALYTFGLEHAVEELAERFSKEHGFETSLNFSKEKVKMGEEAKVLLYRAIHELLVNVAKHANAKNVRIALIYSDKEIKVTVEDDGVGFDTTCVNSTDKKAHGFGLFSIKTRLVNLGGTFEIDSRKGDGTLFVLAMPLKGKLT